MNKTLLSALLLAIALGALAWKISVDKAPLADTALSWLEVFVVGLGEDNCKQDDIECLKRQKGSVQ